jgi:hypothetical protein
MFNRFRLQRDDKEVSNKVRCDRKAGKDVQLAVAYLNSPMKRNSSPFKSISPSAALTGKSPTPLPEIKFGSEKKKIDSRTNY